MEARGRGREPGPACGLGDVHPGLPERLEDEEPGGRGEGAGDGDERGVHLLDDTNVYFTTADGAGVSGVPKTGGPTFVVAQPASGISGGQIDLYLESAILYWDPGYGNGSSLLSVPTAARNAPATIVGTFGIQVNNFAVSGSTAYGEYALEGITALPTTPDAGSYSSFFNTTEIGVFISFQLDAENGTLDDLEMGNGQIDQIPLDGGAMTSIAIEANADVIAIQGDTMYSVAWPPCNGACVSTLYTSALDGSNATLVASGAWPFATNSDAQDCIGAITAKYVFLHVEGGIVRVALATGENHVVYSYVGADPTVAAAPGSIAADDDFLYVVDPTAGLVRLAN